jgi:hypothetical protein
VLVTSMEKVQAVMSATSMNWPSQKSPPFGCPQRVVQLAWSMVEQSTSHATFAWTVHEPLQLSAHSVAQSVEPGCSWQRSVHCVSQLAEHVDEQLSPEHAAMHWALQSVSQ